MTRRPGGRAPRRADVADREPAARRVLVVASELPPGPGGIGAHAHAVATMLARQGRTVRVIGSQHYCDAGERRAFDAVSEVPITRLPDAPDPVRTAWRRRRAIRAEIRSFRPDVVVASGGRILWLSALLSGPDDPPLIAVAHGTELGGPAWQRALTRRALARSTRVVAVSRFTAGLVRTLTGAEGAAPVVIENGADAERFPAELDARRAAGRRFRERHGLADRPIVLTVGNVTERKGQHVVVEALGEVARAVPDVAYVVVGRPTTADALIARARSLGVDQHLVVVGQAEPDEVVEAHAAADVFAMTSTNTATGDVEGYGIAAVEAALSGVPALVSAGTGAAEAVVDGTTGLVVDPRPGPVAAGLVELLTDPERRAAMGRAAERRARGEATWEHRAQRYGELADEVVRGAKPRIVVISHTEHHRAPDGTFVSFGPTTRELDHLASLASELVHVAPLHEGPPAGIDLRPRAANLRYVPVPAVGGPRRIDRLRALAAVPRWVRAIDREVRGADVVHVRAPAGIALVAFGVLALRRHPRDRWVKYAGNWSPERPDAITYRVQRWWLRRGLTRAVVSVNGRWPDQPPWVRTFDNPTLTPAELALGAANAHAKPSPPPLRVAFAGRLEPAKGADLAVQVVLELRRRGHEVVIDLVGDGPLRPWVEAEAAAAPEGVVTLHGWVRRDELEVVLAAAHVFLLPTTASEGFPKVLAEALAFGAVPVTSDVSSIGQVLGETGGAVIVPGTPDVHRFADAVAGVLDHPRSELVATGLAAAERFGYEAYLDRVRDVARTDWGRTL